MYYIDPPTSTTNPDDVSRFISDLLLTLESTDDMVGVTVNGVDIPAIDYLLDTVDPHMDILTLQTYFDHYPNHPSRFMRTMSKAHRVSIGNVLNFILSDSRFTNKYQCLLNDTPVRCIDHWIHANIDTAPPNTVQYQNQLRFADEKLGNLYYTDTCNANGDTITCLDYAIELWQQEFIHAKDRLQSRNDTNTDRIVNLSSLITEHIQATLIPGTGTGTDQPLLCRVTPANPDDTPDTMSCIQKIFFTDFIDPRFVHALFSHPTATEFLDRPHFRQPDGTPQTGYDWLMSDTVFPTFGIIAMEELLVNTFKVGTAQAALAAPYHNTDGETVTFTDRFIEQLHLPRVPGADARIAHIIDANALDLTGTCTTDGKPQSCIDKIIELHNAASESKSSVSIYTHMLTSTMYDAGITSNTCGPHPESCISYILSHLHQPLALMENQSFIDVILSSKTNARRVANNCQATGTCDQICDTITRTLQTTEFTANYETKYTDLYYKHLPILDILCDDCASRSTPTERRTCYDERCFTIANANKKTPWVRDYITKNGMDYRPERDTRNLCGVYDITYVPARRASERERYHGGIQYAIDLLNGALFEHVEQIREYNHITKQATVTPCTMLVNLTPSAEQPDQVTVTYTAISTGSPFKQTTFSFATILSRLKIWSRIDPITYTEIEKVVKTKPSTKPVSLKMVISNRIYDMLRASTCQGWGSCFNLTDGKYRDSVQTYIESGAYIAYLATDEYSTTWLARVYLIPCADAENCIMIQNTQRNYAIDDNYANVLYDALRVILHTEGFNTDRCPDNCESVWTVNLDNVAIDPDDEGDGDFGFGRPYEDHEYMDGTECEHITAKNVNNIRREYGAGFVTFIEKMSER